MKTKNCQQCNKEFTPIYKPTNKKFGGVKFCSRLCVGKYKIGKKHTDDHKKKISLGNLGKGQGMKGKHHTEESKIKIGIGSKRKRTAETRKRASESHKKRREQHWNWKGGITEMNQKIRGSLEYKLWRTAVFERDNYTCIWCGNKKGGNLQADHIKPFAHYPELRFAIDNGRTLCRECHQKTDTYGSKSIKRYENS